MRFTCVTFSFQMFSRAFVPSRLRCYSTPTEALKLWVKHNGSPSIKVPINGCNDIDDFAKKVKQELNTSSQIALFTSLDKQALDPGLALIDLLKTDIINNSSKSPLLVKIIPASQDQITAKTIYIRDTDEDGEFTDKYVEYQIKNKEDLRDIYKFGLGLATLAEPNKAIVSFDNIKDGERYHVYKYS